MIALPREARLPPRRLRLHDLHRQLRVRSSTRSAPRSTRHDLAVVSVLSGNRNFEGRINPDVKMNYLASPPLVVAYALAGTMDIDLDTEPLGEDTYGKRRLPARTSGRRRHEVEAAIASVDRPPRCSPATMPTSSRATSAGSRCQTPAGETFAWDPESTYVRKPAVLRRHDDEPTPVSDIEGARVLAKLGDSVTTDHISPGRVDQDRQPGRQVPRRARRRAQGLQLLWLPARQPRGDDPRHLRQHPPASNQLARRRRGWLHRATSSTAASRPRSTTPSQSLSGRRRPAGHPRGQGVRLRLARATGRRRAPALLGVRAVIAECYERIHRSNLIGMGVHAAAVPRAGQSADSLGLTGTETFSITGITALNDGTTPRTVAVISTKEPASSRQFERCRAHRHPRRSRLLPPRRHHPVRPAVARHVA